MAAPISAPPQPEFGEFQTVYWDNVIEDWVVRDLTDEEIADKFPVAPEPSTIPLTPEQQAEKDRVDRIQELRFMLLQTDYVALPDYDKDKPDILAKRAEWRTELRSLGG